MDGIHDMGGVEGYGPVPYVPDEPISTGERWESTAAAAVFALVRSGKTNMDAFRHRIERIDPTRYLPITYWGRWLATVESTMIDQDLATTDEIEAAIRDLGHDPTAVAAPPRMHPAVALESRANAPGFLRELDRPPRFAVGDRVATGADAPHSGHHRLPRYARGRTGTVARVYPAFTFPDTMAHGRGEAPTYVYAVAFAATELWGPDADPRQTCHIDLFEPYLQPGRGPDRQADREDPAP